MKIDVEIEDVGAAEESTDSKDAELQREPDIEVPHEGLTDAEIQARCSTGHIRRKKVNGICYCQMCCGGTWYYFYRRVSGKKVYHKCGDRPRTVECSGKNFILHC